MFDLIGGVFNTAAKAVEDAIDIGTHVLTLGEYGELNKQNVSRLIAAGMTAYTISEATGIAVELIERVLED